VPDDEELEELDRPPSEVEASEADVLDQARPLDVSQRQGEVSRAIDAPEADALEQAIEVPLDDEDGREA
jgi:hypothetical protein